MNEIEIPIKVKHFKTGMYASPGNCALAQAAQETLNDPFIKVGAFSLRDRNNDLSFISPVYGLDEYNADYKKARHNPDPEAVIRTITLYNPKKHD